MLLGSEFEVPVVTARRIGLVATELRDVLFAVDLEAALVTSKMYNELPLINSQARFIEKNKRRPNYILAYLLPLWGQ